MMISTHRTIQTAVGVFGGDGYTDRMDILPLMVANAGNSDRGAISSLNCPPILAVELCREHLVCPLMQQACPIPIVLSSMWAPFHLIVCNNLIMFSH